MMILQTHQSNGLHRGVDGGARLGIGSRASRNLADSGRKRSCERSIRELRSELLPSQKNQGSIWALTAGGVYSPSAIILVRVDLQRSYNFSKHRGTTTQCQRSLSSAPSAACSGAGVGFPIRLPLTETARVKDTRAPPTLPCGAVPVWCLFQSTSMILLGMASEDWRIALNALICSPPSR